MCYFITLVSNGFRTKNKLSAIAISQKSSTSLVLDFFLVRRGERRGRAVLDSLFAEEIWYSHPSIKEHGSGAARLQTISQALKPIGLET